MTLVEVRGHLMVMQPFHVLNPVLNPVPVALYVLGMYASSRIDKMKGVVDCEMAGNIVQIQNLTICPPFIRVNYCSRMNMCLNDGQ